MVPGLAGTIIESDTNPVRFEEFCTELFASIEKVPIMPTSLTHDRGRDARSATRSRGTHAIILCATLRKDFETKFQSDLDRLSETSDPDRVIYCCSRRLTEDEVDDLALQVKQHLSPTVSTLVVGSLQLANLIEQHSNTFAKFYHAEIRMIEAVVSGLEAPSDSSNCKGLRLAVIAFASTDAAALRDHLSRLVVLQSCKVLKRATTSVIAGQISKDLRLPQNLNSSRISAVLGELQREGLVSLSAGEWTVAPDGEKELDKVPHDAARELLAGRTIIRERLEYLIGTGLADQQYDVIWSTLLDVLSELFHSNGLDTIRAVNGLLDPGVDGTSGCAALQQLLAKGAQRIRATASGTEFGEVLQQAVMDIFTERAGPAFEWLARVCERFVSLCSLGLESTSAEELRRVVRRHDVVLDSHVILSLLCESEPDYLGIRSLLARWRRSGGKLLLSRAVLEEVAHHAWIAETEFRDTEFLLGKLQKDELRRYVENAFARVFHFHCSTNPKNRDKWRVYIGQYRGRSANDYSNLLPLLQKDLGAEILPDTRNSSLEEEISKFLFDLRAEQKGLSAEQLDRADIGKATTDATLLASIAAANEAYRQAGREATIVLLSSSARLRRVHNRFRHELGPRTIITLGTLSYLLSMIPDAQLGPGALRRALFDFGETAHLGDAENLALRVIRGSENIDLPWARRPLLEKQLDDQLHREARRRDISFSAYREQFKAAQPSANADKVIVEAVKALALSGRNEQELVEARRQIKELEESVESLRAVVRAVRAQKKKAETS